MPIEMVPKYRLPRTRQEFVDDGWAEVAGTSVFVNPKGGQRIYLGEHYCGLSGFGMSASDSCPACDAYRNADAILRRGGKP